MLHRYVNEAQWRLELVTQRPKQALGNMGGAGSHARPASPRPSSPDAAPHPTADPSSSTIINRMLASPSTLLTLCLKARDFGQSAQIITSPTFFKLAPNIAI